MSEPEFDSDNKDAESMFDFLAEDGEAGPRRKKPVEAKGDRPLPIIRKPVPVSESGPLLPPKPGAPVEPPPKLTTGSDKPSAGLDFLDDGPRPPKAKPQGRVPDPVDKAQSNVTQLDPRARRRAEAAARPATAEIPEEHRDTSDDRTILRRRAVKPDDLDFLDLDEGLSLNEDWHTGLGGRSREELEPDTRSGRGRWLALILAVLFIAAGVGSFVVTNPPVWLNLPFGDSNSAAELDTPESNGAPSGAAESGSATAYTPSPLSQKFRAEQERIEQLVAAGSLDEAENALQGLDRSVYGYGAAEFAAIETRIGQIRSGTLTLEEAGAQSAAAEAARLAEEQDVRVAEQQAASEEASRLAEEQAAREEASRLAEEQAAREEALRLADEQAARDEASRLAAEQATREEASRLAAEQAAREEASRAAEAQAARDEASRLAEAEAARQEAARAADIQAARDEAARRAEEQAARIEQIRIAEEAARAEAQRLAQSRAQADSAATAALSGAQKIDRDRIATDKRIAEERAALQRQQAREQRLIEAREREAQAEQARASEQSGGQSTSDSAVQASSGSAGQSTETVATANQVISDADLQLVYQRFVNLQQAISQRDINAVVSLTKRSGARVQQFMQIFENSSEIEARIRNVSTSNATGEIKGTLQISRVRRTNGTYVKPPASLSSIALSSKRDDDGWSAISW